jgi:hypothetical protein
MEVLLNKTDFNEEYNEEWLRFFQDTNENQEIHDLNDENINSEHEIINVSFSTYSSTKDTKETMFPNY